MERSKKKIGILYCQKTFSNLVNLIQEESEILSQKNKSKYDSLLLNYDRSFSTKELIELFNTIEKFIKLKLPIILKKNKTQLF